MVRRAREMYYFDTSFLVPLLLPETTSDAITDFVRGLPDNQLAVSHWTRVEFSSLIAREVRMGGLDVQAATQADARFESMVDESFTVLLPNAGDYDLAKAFLGTYETGLRAGDALHLAIAKNHRATTVYSLDKKMLTAGKILGLPVAAGVNMPAYGH